MSDKKLNAIKEIEFRITKCKELCDTVEEKDLSHHQVICAVDDINSLLFDINDFINDLKDGEN